MKKFSYVIAAFWLILLICLAMAIGVTETHTNIGSIMEEQPNRAFKKVTVVQTGTPPADFTETLKPIYGQLMSVVIATVGTDTDFDIIVKDENAFTVFTHTTLTTASVPYRFALVESDLANQEYRGVNVGGECTVEMANGDDATLTSIIVTLYYEQNWQ